MLFEFLCVMQVLKIDVYSIEYDFEESTSLKITILKIKNFQSHESDVLKSRSIHGETFSKSFVPLSFSDYQMT